MKTGKSNGQGLDAVWKVSSNAQNEGKPFAVVEAKSHLPITKKPHGYFKGKNPNKPSMTGRLDVNGMDAVKRELKTLGALLLDGEKSGTADANSYADNSSSGKPSGGKPNTSSGKSSSSNSTNPSKPAGKQNKTQLIVQMSEEWISKNISKAVNRSVFSIFKEDGRKVYSRYIIYSPLYSDSSIEALKISQVPAAIKDTVNHARVLMAGQAEHEQLHREHAAILYNENEVRAKVNKIKAKLKAKYSKNVNVDISNLNQEK